jgi:hypothetical protein
MRPLFWLVLTLVFAAKLAGAESGFESNPSQVPLDQLPGKRSVAPNERYAVQISEDGKLGLVYQLILLKTTKVLLNIKSSYQVDESGERHFAVSTTEGASVYWSKDSRFVAIEESNHRYEGTVLAAFFSAPGKADPATIPLKEIKKRTGERWGRCRLYVDHPPWDDHRMLHLVLAGKLSAEGRNGRVQDSSDEVSTYNVRVRVGRSPVIESVKE